MNTTLDVGNPDESQSSAQIHDAHETHWVARGAFQILVFALALAQGAVAAAVFYGWYWVAVPLVLIASHLMHGLLIGLHEAAHGILRKNRLFNEFDGILLGTFSLLSFSLYRVVHQTHHAHLARERDYEFWPLTQTSTPRWFRRLAAFIELNLGIFFTSFLFLRAFLCRNSPVRSKRVRQRIWAELALGAAVWAGLIWTVAAFDLWKYFIWMYAVPALVAGNLQSWREYIEHVGMMGSTVKGSTRSIVADTRWGRLCAFTLLHEPLHGIHHQRAGLPYFVLPRHLDKLEPETPEEPAPFPSYRHAFVDLIRGLGDPRVGPQWRKVERPR